ncbi:MAG: NADH-ubiquinone oxidoreductase-F iron-sulfur binding region domain-containing protein [Pseudomonadota bacterium]
MNEIESSMNTDKTNSWDRMEAPVIKPVDAPIRDRSGLLPLLFSAQEKEGYLSVEAVRVAAELTGLTDNQVYGFATVYPWFRFSKGPVPDVDGASFPGGRVPASRSFPSIPETPPEASGEANAFSPDGRGEVRAALRNIGTVNPESIDEYIRLGGYCGLSKALSGTPGEVTDIVKRSGLGEEGFPGLSLDYQWILRDRSPGATPWIIGLAAGADPVFLAEGFLLENDPYGVLEGMLIAGYASGASQGILYVNADMKAALSRLETALDQMKRSGRIGNDVRGASLSFQLQLVPAPGPIPCAEALRVIPALEGRRPENCFMPKGAREPVFRGNPAVILSVETLAKLPAVMANGADWYAGLGLDGHRGTRLVTLAGCVARPGVAEIPAGMPLREIIDQIGGGVPDGTALKAVRIGGPSGGWLAADDLDLPYAPEAMAAAGGGLDSGSLVAAGKDVCALVLARQGLLFAGRQSCGHCTICREGTRQMAEILHDIIRGRSRARDLELLEDLSEGLRLGSSCSLGRTAPAPFLTILRRFRAEFEAHIRENRCLSGFCLIPDHESAGGPAGDATDPGRERRDLK